MHQTINTQQYINRSINQSKKQWITRQGTINQSINQAVIEIEQRIDGSEENKTRNKQ